MPTDREREYYTAGYQDGFDNAMKWTSETFGKGAKISSRKVDRRKPKRKLSAWNKYVKANSKKPRFRYRNGKLNLKKMAVAFRKTPAGRKKRR